MVIAIVQPHRRDQVRDGLNEIGGWARKTGLDTILIEDRDLFAHGFVVA